MVVSDSSGARNLRSLLKMPTLLTQSFCDELDRKKKAVSFFDDVTVFLFDQVSHSASIVTSLWSINDNTSFWMKKAPRIIEHS